MINNKLVFFTPLLVSVFFLMSWFLPITGVLWDTIDYNFYYMVNGILSNENAPFWGSLNSRYGDWVSQAILLSFFIRKAIISKNNRLLVVSQTIFTACLIVTVQVLCNCAWVKSL